MEGRGGGKVTRDALDFSSPLIYFSTIILRVQSTCTVYCRKYYYRMLFYF